MKVELRVKAEFEAAHSLSGVLPPEHRCAEMHGHRYEVEVAVSGVIHDGMLVEYETIKAELGTVLGIVDHRVLDKTVSPSTTENLCWWLWNSLKSTKIGHLLSEVRVQETSGTCCVYRGD